MATAGGARVNDLGLRPPGASRELVDGFDWTTTGAASAFSGLAGAGPGLVQCDTASTSKYMAGPTAPSDRAYVWRTTLQALSDPSGRRHAGVVLDWDPAAGSGYRVSHLDGNWAVVRFANATTWTTLAEAADGGATRVHSEIGDIPPAEHEARWYRHNTPALTVGTRQS